MPVSHQDGIHPGSDMPHSLCNARQVGLKTRIKPDTPKVHARKIRIHEESVPMEFELITIRTEIGHAHSVPRRPAPIFYNEIAMGIESRA